MTAAQAETFRRLGYLPVGRVVEPPGVARLTDAFNRLIDPTRGDGLAADHVMRAPDGQVRVGLHLCHVDEAFQSFAADPAIARAMSELLGDEVVVLTSLLFNKPAGTGQPLTPHQDLAYYPYLGDDDLVTCWTALDAVGPRNGAVEYLPGSHRVRLTHRPGVQQALDIADEQIDVDAFASVSLAAGEAVAHHGLLVHRSGPNVSGRPRRGLATLYIRASVKPTTDDFPYTPICPEVE